MIAWRREGARERNASIVRESRSRPRVVSVFQRWDSAVAISRHWWPFYDLLCNNFVSLATTNTLVCVCLRLTSDSEKTFCKNVSFEPVIVRWTMSKLYIDVSLIMKDDLKNREISVFQFYHFKSFDSTDHYGDFCANISIHFHLIIPSICLPSIIPSSIPYIIPSIWLPYDYHLIRYAKKSFSGGKELTTEILIY